MNNEWNDFYSLIIDKFVYTFLLLNVTFIMGQIVGYKVCSKSTETVAVFTKRKMNAEMYEFDFF